MRCLLDTHALVWALSEPVRLPPAARRAIEDPANEVYASAVSAWEIAIKAGLGKIDFPLDALESALAAAAIRELPVTIRDARAVKDLPLHHRDPFDRLLIAQASSDGLVLVTRDGEFAAYSVRTLWQ